MLKNSQALLLLRVGQCERRLGCWRAGWSCESGSCLLNGGGVLRSSGIGKNEVASHYISACMFSQFKIKKCPRSGSSAVDPKVAFCNFHKRIEALSLQQAPHRTRSFSDPFNFLNSNINSFFSFFFPQFTGSEIVNVIGLNFVSVSKYPK